MPTRDYNKLRLTASSRKDRVGPERRGECGFELYRWSSVARTVLA